MEAFPLQWPHDWPRSRSRSESRYKVGYNQALEDLLRELEMLGGSDIVVSTNVPLRRDGLPFADHARRRIDDPGVAVYFKRKRQQQVIACDTWERVHENIRAIGLTVAGLRAVQRAGASQLLNRAFTGFKMLTAGDPIRVPVKREWWEILGCNSNVTDAELKKAWRAVAAKAHPDKGGSDEAMAIVNGAYAEASGR